MPVIVGKVDQESSRAKGRKTPQQYPAVDYEARDRLNQRIKATEIEFVSVASLKPNPRNAKKHSDRQISLLAENFQQFGFTQPIIIDETDKILAGHARHRAAIEVGLTDLPTIRMMDLTDLEKRALALADNKLAELGEWDLEILSEELEIVFDAETELSFDPRIIGFETVEVDQLPALAFLGLVQAGAFTHLQSPQWVRRQQRGCGRVGSTFHSSPRQVPCGGTPCQSIDPCNIDPTLVAPRW